VTGLGLASPAWSLAHASDQPLSSAHAHILFYTCMNSAKIIKLPSHCSSPSFTLQCIKKNVKTECCKWWFQVSVSLCFSFRFYILACIIIQELRKVANIPSFEKTKTMVVLRYLFTVSSTFVRFASSSLPFALSLFFQSLLFSSVLLSYIPFVFVASPLSPFFFLFPWCGSSFGFYS